MNEKYQFDYYYGDEADQFSFFKIPKLLVTSKTFSHISNDAKILYGLLQDRMSLSRKNKWFDEENRVYIVCSIDEIAELLNCSRNKAIKSLQELDTEKGIGLIEKRRMGQGNNTIMYVKNFVKANVMISQQSNAESISEVQKVDFQKSKISTSKSPKNKLLEVQNMDHNNTYNNNTDINKTDKSNLIVSVEQRYDKRCDGEDAIEAYQSIVKENIEYDALMASHPCEKDTIDGIYQLIVETLISDSERVLIASNWYLATIVKSKFMKLNYSHIEYVLERLSTNTTKVRNIKKYILASLFNAPSTISGYYWAEVNHDMPYLVAK